MYDRNRSWIIILLGFLWIYKTLQHYTCIIFISLCYLLESRMFGFLNDCHINQSMNVINYKNTLKCIVYGTIMDRKLSINFARSCMNGMFSVTQALVWKKHQLNCLHNWLFFYFIFFTQKGTFMLYKYKWFFVSYFLWISENGKRFLFQGKNNIYFGIIWHCSCGTNVHGFCG